VAEAKGMPILLLGIIFMLLVAMATSISVQVVGVLLIFSLMVTPAATAQRLSQKPLRAIIISVAIALGATWLGLISAFYIVKPPVSFFITSFVFIFYILVRARSSIQRLREPVTALMKQSIRKFVSRISNKLRRLTKQIGPVEKNA
jgi:zinc/manganese transport system permease protein